MPEETSNLILEHLRNLRAVLDRVATDVADVKMQLSAHNHQITGLGLSDLRQNSELDRLNQRLDRIEKRLELVDGK